jgi:hypothetical protein
MKERVTLWITLNTRTKAGMKALKRFHYQLQAGMNFFEKYPIPAPSCYVLI